MKVNINAVHFKTDAKLEEFITDKVGKLYQFFEEVISADVILKLDSNEKVKDKIVEVRLVIRGNDLFAKKESKSFEDAIDQAVEALRKQITKHKEKIRGI
jgi:putative sigma-54 modulation protein